MIVGDPSQGPTDTTLRSEPWVGQGRVGQTLCCVTAGEAHRPLGPPAFSSAKQKKHVPTLSSGVVQCM